MGSYGKAVLIEETNLGVQEASGLAQLSEDTLLVVDDEAGVFHCTIGGEAAPLDAARGLSDLEGICMAPDATHAYVLAERDGSVWRYAVSEGDLLDGERLGRLPRLAKKKNNGWEGLAWAPAGAVSEKSELVAAHQTKPRQIGFFSPETLECRAMIQLPKDARKELGDLNDLTILPESGHLLVLSGKAGRMAEFAVRGSKLETICFYRIATSKDDVPEGITLSMSGEVWICTDGEGHLRRVRLES